MSLVKDPPSIVLDSPEGRRFLRRVASPRRRLKDRWQIFAGDNSGWKVLFVTERLNPRTRKSRRIIVETDATMTLDGQTGERVVAGADDQPATVIVPRARYVRLESWETTIAARLLVDGWRLSIRHHAGSPKSASLGLGFAEVVARPPVEWNTVGDVTVGSQTITKNGITIVRGACSCD